MSGSKNARSCRHAGPSQQTGKSLKVLVVSDDDGAACAYSAIAKSDGWKAETCHHEADVAAVLTSHKPDAVIFDYDPHAGVAALRALRLTGSQIPVVVIAAQLADEAEMMALDVQIILPHPPGIDLLRETLRALTAKLERSSDMKVLFRFLDRCDGMRSPSSGQSRGAQ